METKTFHIEGPVLITPKVFGDARGLFMESYNQKAFAEIGITCDFVQDNHSESEKNILRGLHYQIGKVQDKLVRVAAGEIYDVAVDIRSGSPTFGQWIGAYLSAENKQQLFVPTGFAHGFQVISERATVLYKASDFYFPEGDRAILWSDPEIDIDWPIKAQPLVSEKDGKAPLLADVKPEDLL